MAYTLMAVAIDASNIRAGGGITHLRELLTAALPERDGFDRVVVWASKRTLDALPERQWLHKRGSKLLEGNLLLRTWWQVADLSRQVRAEHCNVLLVPGGSFMTDFRPVVTMNQNLLPFQWKELLRYGLSATTLKLIALHFSQSHSFRSADDTIFLTEFARSVVLDVCHALPGKLPIVPHGIDERFLKSPRPARPIQACTTHSPFRLIYVSPLEPYKHQWHVAAAVAQLRREGMPVAIDFVGPANPQSLRRLRDALAELDPSAEAIRYLGTISHDQIHAAYQDADLAVFASSCETIGNVLIEGMAAGLSTAASDIGAVREVLGDAALYFNPEEPSQIADAIRTLINSTNLREKNAQLAYDRAKQYSWGRCASETFRALADAFQSRASKTP